MTCVHWGFVMFLVSEGGMALGGLDCLSRFVGPMLLEITVACERYVRALAGVGTKLGPWAWGTRTGCSLHRTHCREMCDADQALMALHVA